MVTDLENQGREATDIVPWRQEGSANWAEAFQSFTEAPGVWPSESSWCAWHPDDCPRVLQVSLEGMPSIARDSGEVGPVFTGTLLTGLLAFLGSDMLRCARPQPRSMVETWHKVYLGGPACALK